MNEAIPTQADSQNPRTTSGPKVSTAAKAQQMSRPAPDRDQEVRRAAVREQALREKMRRLENVERSLPAGDTLANLSDASWEEIKQQLDALHQEAERYIRENPTKSILAAAGAGFVLGLLMKR